MGHSKWPSCRLSSCQNEEINDTLQGDRLYVRQVPSSFYESVLRLIYIHDINIKRSLVYGRLSASCRGVSNNTGHSKVMKCLIYLES